MADADRASNDVLDRSSVMTDMIAFSSGFQLQRKVAKKKGDKFDPLTEPIAPSMKVPKFGLLVVSPKQWGEEWLQYSEDVPEGTQATFDVKEAAGEFSALQTYPDKELWEDYCTYMKKIESDEDEGTALHGVRLCFCLQLAVL
jgi:hypothetical protein